MRLYRIPKRLPGWTLLRATIVSSVHSWLMLTTVSWSGLDSRQSLREIMLKLKDDFPCRSGRAEWRPSPLPCGAAHSGAARCQNGPWRPNFE
eukprot:4586469-Pleurochrysis_carterae.AAC.3